MITTSSTSRTVDHSSSTIKVSSDALLYSELGADTVKVISNHHPFWQLSSKTTLNSNSLEDFPSAEVKRSLAIQRVSYCVTNSTRHLTAMIVLLRMIEYVRVAYFCCKRQKDYMPGIILGGEGYYSALSSTIAAGRNDLEIAKIDSNKKFIESKIVVLEGFIKKLVEDRVNLASSITYNASDVYDVLKKSVEQLNALNASAVSHCDVMIQTYQTVLTLMKQRIAKINIRTNTINEEKKLQIKIYQEITISKYEKIHTEEITPQNVMDISNPYQERLKTITDLLPSFFSLCTIYNVMLLKARLSSDIKDNITEDENDYRNKIIKFEEYVNLFKVDVEAVISKLNLSSTENQLGSLTRNDSSMYSLNLITLITVMKDMLVNVNVVIDTIRDRKILIESMIVKKE